jgi:hypothetical protein
MPKSGDERMIRGHSINMPHHIDHSERFRVMDLIVETVTRTAADQKRSCGFAPHIQVLINSKVGNKTYLLDREHLPLRPEFEDNTVTMDPSHPTSSTAQAEKEARAESAKSAQPRATSAPLLKTKADQMNYLLRATQRIEQSLANLAVNQKSLETIIETKFYDLDVKVTEMQTTIESLKKEVDEGKNASSDDEQHHGTVLPTSTQFRTQLRSAVIPGTSRATVSAPAATPSIAPSAAPVVATPPPVPQTSSEAFADALISTPTSTHTGAASQRSSPSGAAGDRV